MSGETCDTYMGLHNDVKPIRLDINIDPKIDIDIQTLTPDIVSSEHKFLIKVSRPSISEFHPTDIVLIIDISMSMEGSPIYYVKKTLEFIVSQLTPMMRLGIVTFNDESKVLYPLTPMFEGNKKICLDIIDQITPSGFTNIRLGEEMGIRMLRERRFIQPNATIILLSDGEDTSGNVFYSSDRLTEGIPNCVTVNTIGYGPNSSACLETIARRDKGCFVRLSDQRDISNSFATILGGFLTIDLYNIEFSMISNSHFGKFYSSFPSEVYPLFAKITIPTLFGEETREILFDLITSKDQSLTLEVSCNYRVLGKRDTFTIPGRTITAEWGCSDKINKDVDISRSRFICADAIRESSRVDQDTAIKIIRNAILQIDNSAFGKERQCQKLIEDLGKILLERESDHYDILGHLSIANDHEDGRSFTDDSYPISSSQLTLLSLSPKFK